MRSNYVNQWPSINPHPEFQEAKLSSGMKNHQVRFSETLSGSDPSPGRITSGGEYTSNSKVAFLHGLKNNSGKFNSCKGAHVGKRHLWVRKHVRSIACTFVLAGFFFMLDSLMVSISDSVNHQNSSTLKDSRGHEIGLFAYFSLLGWRVH